MFMTDTASRCFWFLTRQSCRSLEELVSPSCSLDFWQREDLWLTISSLAYSYSAFKSQFWSSSFISVDLNIPKSAYAFPSDPLSCFCCELLTWHPQSAEVFHTTNLFWALLGPRVLLLINSQNSQLFISPSVDNLLPASIKQGLIQETGCRCPVFCCFSLFDDASKSADLRGIPVQPSNLFSVVYWTRVYCFKCKKV